MSEFTTARPSLFRYQLECAIKRNPRISANCTLHDREYYYKCKCYMSNRYMAGFAIAPGGELVNVFSLVPGLGDSIISAAIGVGAKRLDCLDGYLPKLYARHGFTVDSISPNWTIGEPDVVYMSLPDKG